MSRLEILLCLVQQDGTLLQILDHRSQLQQVLSQLCGVEAQKEADDTVRAALAESILMLVSHANLRHASAQVLGALTYKQGLYTLHHLAFQAQLRNCLLDCVAVLDRLVQGCALRGRNNGRSVADLPVFC